ncbi:hypothetical protein ONZ45_g1277 [Pleurotus djamor]|nr:hypothetical protein ONZ45_g1277 [Pleurotus djamor]
MFKFSTLLGLVSLVPFTLAVVSEWGQCGGINYSGETVCASGLECVELNPYYSQCLRPTGTPTSSSTTPSSSSSSSSSSPSGPSSSSSSSSTVPTPTTTPSAGNPYVGYDIYLSPYYADEVAAALPLIADPTTRAKAATVSEIPTFIWFDVVAKAPTLGTYLADARAIQTATGRNQLVQIVVYDLPDRDCAAAASNGEFAIANNGLNLYKDYVDQLAAQIAQYPDIRVVAVIEPDSLANMVTNMNVPKCQGAAAAYNEGIIYALQKLNSLGVYMYVDAGHAGWLGWPANLPPSAQLFAKLYTDAGSPAYFRGLATNVSNYNKLRAPTPDPVTSPNPNYDEIHFIESLAPELTSRGFPAHFIVDQGRSAVQGIRGEWGDWCNVNNAGFGTRPTTNTGSSLIDAIVWIKPGGESDGTSDTSAVRYDHHCGRASAKKPAPEAGQWFQAYFQMLVENADPAL